jgi:catechol 2,3-dioxygenase-like lactoylglutathione lyase family enzyme
MPREFLGFDHIDARVASLRDAEPFYDRLLGELGLTRKTHSYVDEHGEWVDVPAGAEPNVAEYYEPAKPGAAPCFIGIIEDPTMTPVLTRIAFRVPSEDELALWRDRLASMGARNVEVSPDPNYPAVFFEDPCGTKLELCARNPER